VAVSGELESTQSTVDLRDETRAALKQEDNIRFAGRVLQDAESGEVMLYTENFFVKFKDEVVEKDCLAVIDRFRLKVKSKLPFAPNSYFVEAEEGTGLKVFDIAEQLLKEKTVEYCHPEMVQERRYKVIHPLQWHLAKTTIGDKTVDAHVNIDAAWKYTKGKGVTLAVIDDGVDIDHPEFAGRIVHPFDATLNTDDPAMTDLDLGYEYRSVAGAFDWTWDQMVDVALDGVDACWLEPDDKAALRARVEACREDLRPV